MACSGQAYNSAMTMLEPFTCTASPQNTSFSGCTAHVWNYNPQAAVDYRVTESGSLFMTFADRGRFPMLKDIYSAGLGTGLPNPNLLPEHAFTYNAGYLQHIGAKTTAQVVLFRSDVHNAIESVYVTDPGNPGSANSGSGLLPEQQNPRLLQRNGQHWKGKLTKGLEFEITTRPLPRLTLQASYSLLDRNLNYDFVALPNVSAVNTAITILPDAAAEQSSSAP